MPNFFINVKEKGAKKAAGNIGTLTGSMKKMAAQVAIAAGGVELFRKAIGRSAEIEGVRRGFDNLANSAGFTTKAFDKFKKATDGTIDNITLMKQANNAMLLGITDSEDQMAQMFDVSQRLGQSLGIDTVQAVESLVTGLGRQSKLMLDNLGIMVDTNKSYEDYADSIGKSVSQLTDQERKTAFVNAAMAEANFLVEQLGAEQLTTKDKIAQMNTALLESLTAFGNLLTPFVIPLAKGLELIAVGASSVIEQFGNLGHEFTGTATSLRGFNVWLKANEEDEEALKNKTAELNAEQRRLKDELAGLTSTGQSTIDFTKDFAMSIDMTGQALQSQNEVAIITQEQFDNLAQSLLDGTMNLDDYMVSQEESTLLTINDNTERAKTIQFLIDETERKKTLIEATKEEGKTEVMALKEKMKVAKVWSSAISQAASINQGASHANALFAKRAAQLESLVNTASAITEALPNIPLSIAIGALGAVQVAKIEAAKFATGADFVTSGPQMMMVGDNPGGREQVSVTPLSSPNIDGPSGGSAVTVNVSGNVLSQDFVEGELAENIKEAIRRGTDFGIS